MDDFTNNDATSRLSNLVLKEGGMGTGACDGALREQIGNTEKGVDELAMASAKTALMAVVATALEGRRETILYHAAAYAQATGNPGSHVVEAAVRQAVREGVEFFLDKLFSGDGPGGSRV